MNLKTRLEKLEQAMLETKKSEDHPTLDEWKKAHSGDTNEKEKFYETWQRQAQTQLSLLRGVKVQLQMLEHDDEPLNEQEKLHERKRLEEQKQKALARLVMYHPELDLQKFR